MGVINNFSVSIMENIIHKGHGIYLKISLITSISE